MSLSKFQIAKRIAQELKMDIMLIWELGFQIMPIHTPEYFRCFTIRKWFVVWGLFLKKKL